MKKSTLLLLATLAANAALVGYVCSRGSQPTASPASGGRPAQAKAEKNSVVGNKPGTAPAIGASPGVALDPGNLRLTPAQWETLLTGDLKNLVAQLRSAGVPEIAISNAVYAQVRARFGDEYARAYGFTGEVPPFWKPEASAGLLGTTPEKRAAQQALQKQMSDLAQEAFGTGPTGAAANLRSALDANPDMLASYRRQYGDLDPEKMIAIQEAIRTTSQERSDLLLSSINTIQLPEDRAKLAELDKKQHDAIAAILTPEELEAYEMRSSSTASQVRSQLAALDPTEEEFKTAYRIQKAFDDKYGTSLITGPISIDQIRERSQHQTELQDAIAAALPPDRADDYRLSLLSGASQLPRLIDRLKLPPATTMDVLAIQKDIQDRAKEVQQKVNEDRTAEMAAARGSVQPGAGRAAAMNAATAQAAANATANLAQRLGALNQETTAKLTAILGPSGFEAYKGYGGSWMNQLTPPAPRGPAAAPGSTIIGNPDGSATVISR